MRQFLIYGLVDPRTLMIRYIGKSMSGFKRPRQHQRPKRKTRCANWVKSLIAVGLMYDIAVLQYIDSQCPYELNDAERWWIAYGRACEWPLTNLTDGGERGTSFDAEERARRGAAMKARWTDPKERAKMVRSRIGMKQDPEWIEKRAAFHRGKKRSEETRQRMSKPRLKPVPPRTDEMRAKLSARMKARWLVPTERDKLTSWRKL